MQHVETVMAWEVRGHPKSPATSFDRRHMTSYSTLVDAMCLSCTVLES